MKKTTLFGLLIALSLLLWWAYKQHQARSGEPPDRVEKGMTLEQVERIIGKELGPFHTAERLGPGIVSVFGCPPGTKPEQLKCCFGQMRDGRLVVIWFLDDKVVAVSKQD